MDKICKKELIATTIRHLRIFIAVAEAGKMSLAAKSLYIAQPTVSQAVAEIEAEYSVRLFDRLSKKLRITQQGRQLLAYARRIVSLFDEMERDMRDASSPSLLRVGATVTVGAGLLPQLAARHESSQPQAQIQAYVDNTQVIEQMLLRGELDLALVEGSISSPELLTEPVAEDELTLACGLDHPLAGQSCVRPEQLEGQAFILREQGSGVRARFEQYLEDRRIQIRPKWVCHSADAILSAAAAGQGLAVVSKLLAEPWFRQGLLRQLPLADACLTRQFCLVWHKDKYLSPPLLELMERIRACRPA